MSFKCVFPKEWGYELIEAMAKVSEEMRLYLAENQIEIAELDLSHIILMYLRIPNTDVNKTSKTVGINFSDLGKICKELKGAEAPLRLESKFPDNVVEKHFSIIASGMTCKLPFIDADRDDIDRERLKTVFQQIKDSPKTTSFKLRNSVFTKVLAVGGVFGEVIDFQVRNQSLTFSCSGCVGDMIYTVMPADYLEPPTLGETEAPRIFAQSYLHIVQKFLGLAGAEATFYLGSKDQPLLIEAKIADLQATFLLSPRVSDEEEAINAEE
jgi:hypothetical protein